MADAKITKDYEQKAFIMLRPSADMEIPLSLNQVIGVVVSVGLSAGTVFLLGDSSINVKFPVVSLVFLISIIFSLIRLNGMSLFTLLIKHFKKKDIRPYCSEGIEGDDLQ